MEQLKKVFDNSRPNENTEISTNWFLTESTCCITSQHGYLPGLTCQCHSYYLCRYLQISPFIEVKALFQGKKYINNFHHKSKKHKCRTEEIQLYKLNLIHVFFQTHTLDFIKAVISSITTTLHLQRNHHSCFLYSLFLSIPTLEVIPILYLIM